MFCTLARAPIDAISRDLCKIASFLQGREPYAKSIRVDDWWEHDGLYFEKENLDLPGLFQIVGTPRSLFEAMPGEDRVSVGVGAVDRTWYLRFLVEWDDCGSSLVGEFAVTVAERLVGVFQSITAGLECHTWREDAASFFARRYAG